MVRVRRPRVCARRARCASLVGVAAVLTTVCSVRPAGAGVTTFTMSPAAGPPGTVVHVRGDGCPPGLLGSGDANFVTVTAATLDIAFRAPVAADGTWSGAFTVPRDGAGPFGPTAPVTAGCVSSNVVSLTTVYTPKSFTVTAGSSTTRPAPPAGGGPVPSTVSVPGDPAAVIGVPTTGEHADGASTGTARPGAGATTANSSRSAHAHAAGPATLQPAGIDARSVAGADGAGLGWLVWTLLVGLVLALLGASGVLWWARQPRAVMPGGAA